jgi:hypothetical protein
VWLWSRSNGHGRPPTNNANMDSGFGVKTLLYKATKSTTDRPLLPRPSPSFAGIVQYYGRERHDISHCWTTWVIICSSYGRVNGIDRLPIASWKSPPWTIQSDIRLPNFFSMATIDPRLLMPNQNAAGATPITRVFTAEEYILARESESKERIQ